MLASFYVIREEVLDLIAMDEDDDAVAIMRREGRSFQGDPLFPWPGEHLLALVTYLERQDDEVMHERYGDVAGMVDGTVAVLGPESTLDPEAFSQAELRAAMTDKYLDGTDAVMCGLDGLSALRYGADVLRDDELLVVTVN